MASVFAVAKYILVKRGSMSAMKLQKLVYYSQAWNLVWNETPLFNEEIEAWKNGPVVRALYEAHKGKFAVSQDDFAEIKTSPLTAGERKAVDGVMAFYGDKTAQWLSDLTHMEAPWVDARAGTPDGENCDKVISHASMHEYYASIA